jgi:hypothetical protein
MFRRVFLTTAVFFYAMALSVIPAIAYNEWDGMGRGGGSSLFGVMIVIAVVIAIFVGAHHVLKEIDSEYIGSIIFGCIVAIVIGIVSAQVFDYTLGWGWFLTIFIATIYFEKQGRS